MSFIKCESFPCWSLIFKTIKVPAGLRRSKGRRILTFPPVLHLRSLDIFTTSPPPKSQNCCMGHATPMPTPKLWGSQRILFIQLVYPQGFSPFLPPPKKTEGAKRKPPGFFSLSYFSFWQLPRPQDRHPRARFTSTVLPITPLFLVFYFRCDHGAFLVHRQERCNRTDPRNFW